MKYSMKIMSLLLAMFCSASLFAQTEIGIRGGINVANYDEDPFAYMDSNMDQGAMIGANVALFAKVPVTSLFSIQPEFQWVQKGTKSTMTTTDDMDVEMTLKYSYLELPVLARFDVGGEFLTVNFFVGPSFGYALNKKYIGKNADISNGDKFEAGDFEKDLDWDKEYGTDGTKDNRFDFSAVAGIGLSYDIGLAKIILDTRYNHDFTDLTIYEDTPSPEPDKYRSRSVSITAGFSVPLSY